MRVKEYIANYVLEKSEKMSVEQNRQGEVFITKAMVSAALREQRDSGLLVDDLSGTEITVRNMICAALSAGGVFYKIRSSA